MITLEDFRFFSTVATADSLAAAARTLNVTSSAVTQRLRQIEGRLGVQLVDRSTRHFVLTPEGELVAARGDAITADADNLLDVLMNRRKTVTGHLRIAAPFGFGRRYVSLAAAKFRKQYPEASVSLELLENPAGRKLGTWDIIIHIGELRDSSMVMRRLARNDRILCASPEYLERRGEPTSPADLVEHDCAVLRENDEDATLWRFTDRDGTLNTVRIRPVMTTNDGEVLHEWALSGVGIIMRSEWDVASDVKAGRLVRLLPDWGLGSADIVALLGTRNTRVARTTYFLQVLQELLTPAPWRM